MKQISDKELAKIEQARLALFEWFDTLPKEEHHMKQYHRLAEFIDITQVLWRIAHIKRDQDLFHIMKEHKLTFEMWGDPVYRVCKPQ